MTDRLAIVGDVHGDVGRLAGMLRLLSADARRVVFVGDYVNRGPDSAGVLSLLLDARRELGGSLTLLLGNHELATLEYLDGGILPAYAAFGGMSTIRSYV